MHLRNRLTSEHGSKYKRSINRPVEEEAPDMSTKTIASAELFDGLREIIILHASEKYILRITSTGKLILTK